MANNSCEIPGKRRKFVQFNLLSMLKDQLKGLKKGKGRPQTGKFLQKEGKLSPLGGVFTVHKMGVDRLPDACSIFWSSRCYVHGAGGAGVTVVAVVGSLAV